jgi:hypothetical protein
MTGDVRRQPSPETTSRGGRGTETDGDGPSVLNQVFDDGINHGSGDDEVGGRDPRTGASSLAMGCG